MAATMEDVRQALLNAHPYKIEDLDYAAKLAMEVMAGKKPAAKKLLRDCAKVPYHGHFGVKERAERVITRLDEWAPEPEQPADEEDDSEASGGPGAGLREHIGLPPAE